MEVMHFIIMLMIRVIIVLGANKNRLEYVHFQLALISCNLPEVIRIIVRIPSEATLEFPGNASLWNEVHITVAARFKA
jgi:hypothetical protein